MWGGIIETITNENGIAIKFANGTMIQYHTILLNNFAITNSYALPGSNDYYKGGHITFPEQFVGVNTIVHSVNSPNHLVNISSNGRSNNGFNFNVFCSTSLTTTIEIYYIAIGRWK